MQAFVFVFPLHIFSFTILDFFLHCPLKVQLLLIAEFSVNELKYCWVPEALGFQCVC